MQPGEILGMVGESGAGKSLTGAAIAGLLQYPGRIRSGEIWFGGQRIDNLETSVGKRIDGLGTRVSNLEAEDKRLIEKTAKLSALGGGVGGALAAAAVELIKRI